MQTKKEKENICENLPLALWSLNAKLDVKFSMPFNVSDVIV